MTLVKSNTHKARASIKRSRRKRPLWMSILIVAFIVICFGIVLLAIWGRVSAYSNHYNYCK